MASFHLCYSFSWRKGGGVCVGWEALRAQARMELAAGPVQPWPDQAGLQLLSNEIVRSPGNVCQEQVVTQAAMRDGLPPTATARRQHSNTVGR